MFTNFESRKEFHKIFFLFEVEVFNWDQNGQKNTDISVYSNLLTANIFESGPMPTPWKFLDRPPLLPSYKLD